MFKMLLETNPAYL